MKRLIGTMGILVISGFMVVAEEAKTVMLAPNILADVVKAACQNEMNAMAEYRAFATKADKEGYQGVAALFRAAAESESIHLRKHKAALKEFKVEFKAVTTNPEVQTTKENLAKMIADKTALKDKVNPAAVKQAEADKNTKLALSFKGAMAADGEYIKYAGEAVLNLDAWKVSKAFFVCDVCSFVMTDPQMEKCPICAAPRSKFETFK